jgi:hypothetical protein
MFGYALSGSFDDAMNAWRSELDAEGKPIDERNDMLIARVGKAAMTGYLDEPANSGAAAQNAMRIVSRGGDNTAGSWKTTAVEPKWCKKALTMSPACTGTCT